MADPSAQVIERMVRLTTEFSRAKRAALVSAASQAKTAHLVEIRADTGDLRMSGVGRNGARVGVRYRVLNEAVVVQATGPVHLLERPSKAHTIVPRRRRSSGKKAVATPAGPRASANHPGVRNPPRSWSKGFRRAQPTVTKTIQRQYGSAFARAMR